MSRLSGQGEEYKAAVSKRIDTVQCRFGDKLRIELENDGTLAWTIAVKAPNQGDFVYYSLMNELHR